MRKWAYVAVGVTAGLVLSTALYVAAAPARVVVPARVGVVDFRRVLENYQKMTDHDKQVTAQEEAFREEVRKRSTEIQQLNARLAMHTPGSKAYTDTEKEITAKKTELKAWGETKANELIDRQRELIREIYRDLETGAAEYAKANGLNLILKADRLELTALSIRELDLRVTLKKILYVSKELDITDDVIALLNAQYRKEKAAQDLEKAVK